PIPLNGALQVLQRGSDGSIRWRRRRAGIPGSVPVSNARHLSFVEVEFDGDRMRIQLRAYDAVSLRGSAFSSSPWRHPLVRPRPRVGVVIEASWIRCPD